MPARRLASPFVGMLAAAAIPAQRPVITVGGVNPAYPDLPAAVAAAPPGAILEVRPGTYTGFTTAKALRVVLQGCTVQPPAGAAYTIAIEGVAGSDQFVVLGESATVLPGALGAVRVHACSAPVVIESMLLIGGPWRPALDVQDTGIVHVSRSILLGDPGLQAQLADLTVSEDVIGNTLGCAAVVADSRFESVRSILGGTGQAALRVYGSTARLASDGTGAMLVLGSPTGPVSAFEAWSSVVQWDPTRFALAPANGAPAYEGLASTELQSEVPMLTAGPAPLGGVAQARITAGAPTAGLIAAAPLQPLPLALGPLVLYPDPATLVVVVVGLTGPAGLVYSVTVPNVPALRGELLCLQGSAAQGGGTFTLSAPAIWYLE